MGLVNMFVIGPSSKDEPVRHTINICIQNYYKAKLHMLTKFGQF